MRSEPLPAATPRRHGLVRLRPGSGPAALERYFQAALAEGRRVDCLRAVLALHDVLRQRGEPWAGAACQVWIAGLSTGVSRRLRRLRAATDTLLFAGRLDWACRSLAQEGRFAMIEEDWALAVDRLTAACETGLAAQAQVPPEAWVALWSRRGHAHWRLGQVALARHAWEAGLAAAEAAGLEESAAACHASLALCLWTQGEPAAGYVHSSTALNWYRSQGRPGRVARILYNAALMLEDFGHWRDATILLYEARDTAREAGDGARIVDTGIELAHAYVALGRLPEALGELAEARAAEGSKPPLRGGAKRRQAELCIAEAHVRLAQRRFEDALRLLRRARSLVADANRPILSRRVARHLSLAVQAGGGRLTGVTEMLEIIRALTPSVASGPSMLVRDTEAGRRAVLTSHVG